MKRKNNSLVRDLIIIVFSVILAIILVRAGTLNFLLISTREIGFLSSFMAGIFFVSVFSVAPATVVLAEIAKSTPVLWVAFFGGMGALVGDLVIFHFIKDRLAEDISYLIEKNGSKRLFEIFRIRLFRWLIPFLGALVVASPLPDELGLMMMGFSKMKTSLFIPLSFILNFLGILAIGYIAKIAF